MSIRNMTLVWDAVEIISDRDRLAVMLALADWSNDAGECWPSMDLLAEKSRMSVRHARDMVRALEADELLSVTIRRGRHRTNLFKINLPQLVPVLSCKKPVDNSVDNSKDNRHSMPVIPIKPAQEDDKTGTVEQENRHGYIEAQSDEPSRTVKIRTVKGSVGAETASTPEPVQGVKKSDPRVVVVIRHFAEQCQKPVAEGGRGFKPEITGKRDGAMVQAALKSLDVGECCQAIDFFLRSEKADELGITLSIALSAHSINLWRQKAGAIDEAFNALVDVLDQIDLGEQGAALSHEKARLAGFVIGWEKVKAIYQRAGPLGLRPVFEREFIKL